MRCYLMRKGHIAAVEFLTSGPDEALIEQGKIILRTRPDGPFDGFEVWDGARRVYVQLEEPKAPAITALVTPDWTELAQQLRKPI